MFFFFFFFFFLLLRFELAELGKMDFYGSWTTVFPPSLQFLLVLQRFFSPSSFPPSGSQAAEGQVASKGSLYILSLSLFFFLEEFSPLLVLYALTICRRARGRSAVFPFHLGEFFPFFRRTVERAEHVHLPSPSWVVPLFPLSRPSYIHQFLSVPRKSLLVAD